MRFVNRFVPMFLCLMIFFSNFSAFAQAKQEANLSGGSTRRNLTTIVFAGLAGAVLGLSTLSFYGRPQDKLSNIAVGAAIGIIGGAFYSTYKAATEPRDFYNLNDTPELWRLAEQSRFNLQPDQSIGASWQFNF